MKTGPNIWQLLLWRLWADHDYFDDQPRYAYIGGCQNVDPFLGTLEIRCRIIMDPYKGTRILTTTPHAACGDSPMILNSPNFGVLYKNLCLRRVEGSGREINYIEGLGWDNGKEDGNYYLGFRV